MKLRKKPAVKLFNNTPITHLSSLCNCTIYKCQELALSTAPVLFTTPNSLLLYIVGDPHDFLPAKSLIVFSYFIFLAKACSTYRIARLCSMPPRNKPAKNFTGALYQFSTVYNINGRNSRTQNDVNDDFIDWSLPNKIPG